MNGLIEALHIKHFFKVFYLSNKLFGLSLKEPTTYLTLLRGALDIGAVTYHEFPHESQARFFNSFHELWLIKL